MSITTKSYKRNEKYLEPSFSKKQKTEENTNDRLKKLFENELPYLKKYYALCKPSATKNYIAESRFDDFMKSIELSQELLDFQCAVSREGDLALLKKIQALGIVPLQGIGVLRLKMNRVSKRVTILERHSPISALFEGDRFIEGHEDVLTYFFDHGLLIPEKILSNQEFVGKVQIVIKKLGYKGFFKPVSENLERSSDPVLKRKYKQLLEVSQRVRSINLHIYLSKLPTDIIKIILLY